MAGEFGARKLKSDRKKYKWRKFKYRQRVLKLKKTKDPLGGAPQARGLVLEKRQIEQKQPHSGLIKAVRVKLIKNGKEITAFVPRTGSIAHINEHDQVMLEGINGSQGGAVGSMWGVKWKVCAVNGVPLELIRTGKKAKPAK